MNTPNAETPTNAYPSWAPRFWHGMRAGVWWKMLARNAFRISPSRLHIALGVSLITPSNDLMWLMQELFFGRRIRQTELKHPPVFILGHWRSGTTLLHELLVSNPRFACPTTYQCFAPWHFLISAPVITRFGNFLLPEKRPMDDMAAGWSLPQEDEFALMNLGLPSPYLRIAFPNTQDKHLEYLDMEGLTQRQNQRWHQAFYKFLQAVTYAAQGKQLVLKSPTHTGRLASLYQAFPQAKFIHLTRDPRKLFPSTLRLWRSLDQIQGLQSGPSDPQLKSYVVECLRRMYQGYNSAAKAIPASQIIEIRYENLVAHPAATIQQIYEHLGLADFCEAKPYLDSKLVGHKDYKPNRHRSDPSWENEVMDCCADYAKQFGYSPAQAAS